jgi:hypothetical protein
MRNSQALKSFLIAISICIAGGLFAQTAFDGNAIPTFLGKATNSTEVSDLVKNYHLEIVTQGHYVSKEGIELVVKDGTITEIYLYDKSTSNGSFTAKLPNDLKFGISPEAVKALLGKPTQSYMRNGYCEFEFPTYGISCWFEGGKLNQVGITPK